MVTFSSLADDIFDYPVLDFTGEFIAGSGISADDKKSLIPVGTVSIWTQNEIPEFWLECDGRVVDPVRYPELRKLMSTLPDYRGRFLQGIDTNKNVGDRIEAGLPNISGWINNLIGNRGSADRDPVRSAGAFHHPTKVRHDAKGGDDDFGGYTVYFDAAYSNSIYGKSNTVQPSAVIVKYIIKAE